MFEGNFPSQLLQQNTKLSTEPGMTHWIQRLFFRKFSYPIFLKRKKKGYRLNKMYTGLVRNFCFGLDAPP